MNTAPRAIPVRNSVRNACELACESKRALLLRREEGTCAKRRSVFRTTRCGLDGLRACGTSGGARERGAGA